MEPNISESGGTFKVVLREAAIRRTNGQAIGDGLAVN
jgi:hypothetical protein